MKFTILERGRRGRELPTIFVTEVDDELFGQSIGAANAIADFGSKQAQAYLASQPLLSLQQAIINSAIGEPDSEDFVVYLILDHSVTDKRRESLVVYLGT